MFSLNNPSLISKKILQFYKSNAEEQSVNLLKFFEVNGTFNAKEIVEYIWAGQEIYGVFQDLKNYTYSEYLQCYKKIVPIFQYTDIISSNLQNDLKIKWMGENVLSYVNMRSNYYYNNKAEIFEHILILTSLLANALTNVYLTQSQEKHAPYLLKDLIDSGEIQTVFGLEMVLILKILMGSPKSINLRNIVWHGFPKPLEIPNYYVNVLLITIHTLGNIIESKGFQIKERAQITTFCGHLEVLEKDFKFYNTLDLKHMEQKIKELNSEYKLYWLKLLTHYNSEKYIEFIILVLPQIELLLRLHYGLVNNFDISAKLNEYYITIDTIFETKLPKGAESNDTFNKLLDFEDFSLEGCSHLLYDIFISPNGCRLRDKVSHGEVAFEALNNPQLCFKIFCIFFALLFPKEFKFLEIYESKLHLNSITKANILKSLENFQKFLSKYLKENYKENFLEMNAFKSKKVLIFKRPKKESELMLLINKIVCNTSKTIQNYEDSITFRSELLVQRELHSKRRKTLKKLQNSLPDICRTLTVILSSVIKLYCLSQSNFSVILQEDNKHDKTLRFLKHSLSISENFVKYSHYESNEWIKSLELCHKYEEFYRKLFIYDKL